MPTPALPRLAMTVTRAAVSASLLLTLVGVASLFWPAAPAPTPAVAAVQWQCGPVGVRP